MMCHSFQRCSHSGQYLKLLIGSEGPCALFEGGAGWFRAVWTGSGPSGLHRYLSSLGGVRGSETPFVSHGPHIVIPEPPVQGQLMLYSSL